MHPLWRTVRRFLKKLKIELPYDPAIPLLGIYPEKRKFKFTKTPVQERLLQLNTQSQSSGNNPDVLQWMDG